MVAENVRWEDNFNNTSNTSKGLFVSVLMLASAYCGEQLALKLFYFPWVILNGDFLLDPFLLKVL